MYCFYVCFVPSEKVYHTPLQHRIYHADYSWVDYILLALGLVISGMVSIFCKFDKTIPKRYFLVFFSIFLMTIAVFFISQYPPIAFGFENRILLWVKFSSSLLLGYLIYNGLAFTKKKSYQKLLKIILFLFLMRSQM